MPCSAAPAWWETTCPHASSRPRRGRAAGRTWGFPTPHTGCLQGGPVALETPQNGASDEIAGPSHPPGWGLTRESPDRAGARPTRVVAACDRSRWPPEPGLRSRPPSQHSTARPPYRPLPWSRLSTSGPSGGMAATQSKGSVGHGSMGLPDSLLGAPLAFVPAAIWHDRDTGNRPLRSLTACGHWTSESTV